MSGAELAVIGAVSSVVGTVSSINAQRSASKAQQEQQTLTTRRSRRQAIRETQIRRAQAIASAQGAGAMYGSGAAGGIGSLSSQLGETLGYQSQYGALSNIITSQSQQAAFWGDIANFGGNLVKTYGFPKLSKKTPTNPSPTYTGPSWEQGGRQ
jgi:hypothetical protein